MFLLIKFKDGSVSVISQKQFIAQKSQKKFHDVELIFRSSKLEDIQDLRMQFNNKKYLRVELDKLNNIDNGSKGSISKDTALELNKKKNDVVTKESISNSEEETKGSPERFQIISDLRKQGNYEYNKLNKNRPILARRTYKMKIRSDPESFLPCPSCNGFYSNKCISRHYVYCCQEPHQKGASRSVLKTARSMKMTLHSVACKQLRDKILPPMRQDNIFETIKKDKLILMVGNHFVPKYREHQEYIIRQKLRFLANYFLTVKTIDPSITELEKLFCPQNFETAIESVQRIGGLNTTNSKYHNPNNAVGMTHLLKVCCSILQSYYIREQDELREKSVKRFAKLLATESAGRINKPANIDFCETKRKQLLQKKCMIPQTKDVNKFKSYILKSAADTYKKLHLEGFTYINWKTLAELTLVYTVVYNRKRSGEVQRILVEDCENMKNLTDTTLIEDMSNLLPSEQKEAESTYKLLIKGKLHRTVPVFIPYVIKLYITYILQYREQAGVSADNPYLFGLPGLLTGKRHKLLETCSLIRKYTSSAKLQNPKSVRTILLRKHLATKASALNLKDAQRDAVVDFMGHHKDIHKEYYRQDVVSRDLTVKKILDHGTNISENNEIEENRILQLEENATDT